MHMLHEKPAFYSISESAHFRQNLVFTMHPHALGSVLSFTSPPGGAGAPMHPWWRILHHWCICIGLVPKPGNYQKCQNIRKLPFLKLYPRKQILHCMNISGKGDAGDIKNSVPHLICKNITYAKTSYAKTLCPKTS